jgi:cell division protein FtsI/penicillin-binding protein 2
LSSSNSRGTGRGSNRGASRKRVAPSSRRESPRRLQPVANGRRTASRSPGRLIFMFFLTILLFAGMLARLFVLQIVEAPEYAKLAADQRERDITFAARRGTIFDRGGDPLAISVDLKTIFADPAHVTDALEGARKLAGVLDLKESELLEKLQGSTPESRFEYIARQVSPSVARKVRQLDVPGVYMKDESKRYYPGGRLASHVLGFVNIDQTVRAGIEAQYQEILEGKAGRMTLEQDPMGRALPQAEFTYEPPAPGRSLFLTIDKELQYFTELTLADAIKRYSADAGTAIVMRPGTGEILAMANAPDFDPNTYAISEPEAQRNRALTDMYEPGSAFKIVTMAAALEEGVVTPDSTFTVPDAFQYYDRVFNDSHDHPTETMSVSDILRDSSNVGTIKVGLELGEDKLDEWIKRFGFGQETGLDFPAEAPGIMLPRKLWSGTTAATLPIGQGIAVTPMQMATAYATVANGGVWVEPKLLHSTMDESGKMHPASRPASRRIFSQRTAKQLSRMLERVVSSGTGLEAQVPGYRVGGKTGTAQKPLPTGGYGRSYIASFAGFAPVRDPQIVVLVVLDEPNPIWGGATAAPTFKTIAEFALRHLGVAPQGNAEKAAEVIESEQAESLPAHD